MSLVPDRGCRFTYARLDVRLEIKGSRVRQVPVAVDMFPREVSSEQKFSRSFGLRGGLKVSFTEVALEATRQADTIEYEPLLVGAGLLTDSPNWTFSSNGAAGVLGTKELFILVKKPRRASLLAQFAVAAEVRTAFGPGRYAKDKLLDRSYSITPVTGR